MRDDLILSDEQQMYIQSRMIEHERSSNESAKLRDISEFFI